MVRESTAMGTRTFGIDIAPPLYKKFTP